MLTAVYVQQYRYIIARDFRIFCCFRFCCGDGSGCAILLLVVVVVVVAVLLLLASAAAAPVASAAASAVDATALLLLVLYGILIFSRLSCKVLPTIYLW